ncbi:MAG: glycosyltransferase, partial [Pseudomonadota bacterium]
EWACPDEQEVNEPVILYSGAFAEQDELENLIQAFGLLKKKGLQFRVVMLGGNKREPNRVQETAAQIEQLGLTDVVEMKGFVPLEQVRKQLCQSNILINIRRDGIWSRSGLSTKLSEYLASGRMVISSEVGEVEYYLKDGKSALLVSGQTTAKEIAQALERGLASLELRQKIGAAGRQVALKNFDVNVVKETLLVMLSRVVPN